MVSFSIIGANILPWTRCATLSDEDEEDKEEKVEQEEEASGYSTELLKRLYP